MIRRTIDGIECVFYEQNLFHDNLVLIKYGNEQATTKQIKIHIDSIIEFIRCLIDACSIVDERLEKYAKALSVYKAIKATFNRRKPESISIEIAKVMYLRQSRRLEIAVAAQSGKDKKAPKNMSIGTAQLLPTGSRVGILFGLSNPTHVTFESCGIS